MKCLKLLLLAVICLPLVGCAASQKSVETESASTEWRIKSLEESFLNFREQQRKTADEDAKSRADLEKRMQTVEAELAALRAGQAPADAPRGETWSSDLKPDESAWVEGGKPAEGAPMVKNDAEQPWAKVPEPPAAPEAGAEAEPSAAPEPPRTIPEPEVLPRSEAPKPAVAEAAPAPKPVAKPAAKPAPKPAAGGATALYEKGYAQYNAGAFPAARQTFDDFLARYPKNDLTPNALYWKGETYYSEQDYAQAILAFKEVTGRFPKHDKAAAALLKIGMSYDRVGDPDNAIFYLRALVEDFPKSSPAGLGRKELARLGG
ncbi:tol-pal system protein YbgF [Pseudodesulfovibrio mercurii]|uniref:Tol-pal system protein YbgF n=1 Tax=Pseudodesulfovibrio mercurii TaxID=641491 RepID=F0JDZ7_9BACT|nr:tol-pal system protein YbgF [Pseudodesulfovibrio mercurii]EGB13437.1 tol-pal system protein YbgF [Pseudodesulfovibrio mercurii]